MRVLLSIKPEYAEKILRGEKKYEFRRTLFKDPTIKTVVIYASSPIKKIIGEFEVDYVLSLDLGNLWLHTMHSSGVAKEFYDSYFHGKEIGHAIRVKKAIRYRRYLELGDCDIKCAPQSFLYLGNQQFKFRPAR